LAEHSTLNRQVEGSIPSASTNAPVWRAGRIVNRMRNPHFVNAGSAIYLFSARVVVSVLQLRFVESVWGGSYSGLNALSNQVLLYMTLLELGLAQSAITFLYEPIAAGNHERVSGLVCALRHDIRRLLLLGACIAFPVLAAYAHAIHSQVPIRILLPTLWLIAATGLIQLATLHFQVYLNAAERISRVNVVLGTGYLVKTAIGLPLAMHYHRYLLLPLTIAALSFGEFAALRIAFRHSFPQFSVVRKWKDIAATIRSRAKYVVVHRVSGLAYYQSDFIILSLTTSLVMVKDYAKFQYVAAALLSVIGMIAVALTASLARLQLRKAQEARRQQYILAQRSVALMGAVLMLAYWFTAQTVVNLAFGHSSGVTRGAIILFGIALLLNIVKTADDAFLAAKGLYEIGIWIPVVEVPTYLISGYLLSRRMGIEGILLASICTNVAVSVVCKGMVLAGPIFDSTRVQWFRSRIASIARGCAIVSPLVLLYAGAPRVLPHRTLLEFAAVNGVAGLYALAIIRRMVATYRGERRLAL
jgi:O-antigen/teichoic acid export membrane protein